MEEGCLSLPEQFAEIERPQNIVVEYLDENNKQITKEVSGVESRILQHEIDHLSGKLFVDYLSCLLYTSPSPRDGIGSRMPSSA